MVGNLTLGTMGNFFNPEFGRYSGYECEEPIEPTVGPVTITNSFNMAQNMIQMIKRRLLEI